MTAGTLRRRLLLIAGKLSVMKFKIEVSPWFCVILAGGILLLPVRVLLAALAAVSVHELAHLVALVWCDVPVHRIFLGMRGARIHTGFMTSGQEAICAAAGPAGSFLLLLLRDCFPPIAVIGAVQGIYNLLPVYPLDGGRVVHAVLDMIAPNRCREIVSVISAGTVLLVFILLWRKFSAEAALTAVALIFMTYGSRNISCKDGHKRVQ